MKKLIIVCDKSTEKHANYLRQLISANDDKGEIVVGVKDGEVDAVVWTEDQYKANSPTINSSQHILFIGDGNIAKNESANIKFMHKRFGMKYGWLGKRAVAFVDKGLNEKEYNEFLEYCKEFGKENEKISFKLLADKKKEEKNEAASNDNEVVGEDSKLEESENSAWKNIAIVEGAMTLFGRLGALGALGFNSLLISGKIKEQQYSALITILYLKDLESFMES